MILYKVKHASWDIVEIWESCWRGAKINGSYCYAIRIDDSNVKANKFCSKNTIIRKDIMATKSWTEM
jgi:hypothetical protein